MCAFQVQVSEQLVLCCRGPCVCSSQRGASATEQS